MTYIIKLHQKYIIITLMVLFGAMHFSYGQITGSTSVQQNSTHIYQFYNGQSYTPNWIISGGTLLGSWSAGTTYFVEAKWDGSLPSGTVVFTSTGNYLYVSIASSAPSTPSTPTIQSSNCGNTVLARGTPPSGVTWYWQSSSGGTSTSNSSSTITKTSNGTQYLRARNTSGTWSTASSSKTYTISQATIWYADTDGDTLGDINATQSSCTQPSGYVSNGNDQCPTQSGTVANNGCPPGYENINWILMKSYDLNGALKGSSKSYYNGLGKNIQTQSLDVKTNRIWATQTLYDTHGRPALQTLGAPTNSLTNEFQYNPGFVKNDLGNTYSNTDFETNPEAPSTVGTGTNTLGWYYSDLNTNTFQDGNSYQDITSYPFSRNIYSTLNPGQVLKTLGGNKVDISGTPEWVNGYSFAMPVAQELHYAFGPDNIPDFVLEEEQCAPYVGNWVEKQYDIMEIGNMESCTPLGGPIMDVYFGPYADLVNNKVYKMSLNGAEEKYFIVLSGEAFSMNPSHSGEVTCGPYDSCDDVALKVDYLKATKTVVRDVHGIETVVFTDSDGNTLAAARSGNEDGNAPTPYTVVSPIGEQGFVDIHIPVGCGGTVSVVGNLDVIYSVYDLITENRLYTNTSANSITLNPGFYRIEETTTEFHKNPYPYTKINGSSIDLIDNTLNIGVSYQVNYYDYSLNFYDKAGRLTQSVQPEGFDDALTLSTSVRNHQLSSTFSYNSLGQLLSTTSPDEGTANFKYRKDGQIRFSQNSLQADPNEDGNTSDAKFSYTNYDNLGRPIESGVVVSTGFNAAAPDNSITPSGTKIEEQFTKYDYLESADITFLTNFNSNYSSPSFLSGNVAKTSNDNTTTYYSYDIYGRVKWLVQDISGLGTKSINYTYDPITGAVTEVDYQKYNTNERFKHRYTYDTADNSLIKVETSTDDGQTYVTQANYEYYETGALKRVEIAPDGSGNPLQGLDYVYNINGQLKSINHPSLTAAKDPGGDANDLFGMTIDYHKEDYARALANIETTDFGQDQYNGNIKSIRWNNSEQLLPDEAETTYHYQYNKNNWLADAHYGTYNDSAASASATDNETSSTITTSGNNLALIATNSITLLPGFHAQSGSVVTAAITVGHGFQTVNGDYDVTGITYDANGNIQTLNRNKDTDGGSNAMDDLSYNYDTVKSNRLLQVIDGDGDVAGADDIDSQNANNYEYNAIGQLIKNNEEGIEYEYNTSGLVTNIKKNTVTLVKFFYNDKGHRVKKEIYNSGGSLTETDYYVRDAAGSVMSIYKNTVGVGTVLKEQPIYGASRLGVYNRVDGSGAYQLTDHLGNVRAVVGRSSNGTALGLVARTDYYPYGMPMPNRDLVGDYRYAFQGQEKDPETGKEAFQLRLWDARIGRWQRPDPMRQYYSPYLGMGNIPSSAFDGDGGYVYIMGANGALLRVYNKVMGAEIGASAIDYFINNPDKHVIISAASTTGAGGVTSYYGNVNSSTYYTSRTKNSLLARIRSKGNVSANARREKYGNHFSSFIGAKLQVGDVYLTSIDMTDNHSDLEAAFHEIYAHAYAKDALGIKNTVENPVAEHFYIGGSINGRYDNVPENGSLGPLFIKYPIEAFFDSDAILNEQGAAFPGGYTPDFGRMNSLIFGTKSSGSAKQVKIIVGPLEQGRYEN